MTKSLLAVLTIGVLATGLQGCAGIIIGGAATGASVAHDRRSAGTVLDDETIEIKAEHQLRSDKVLDALSHINVTSYNNVVLLTGETPKRELKARAEELVRGVAKVRDVHNEIAIAEPSTLLARSTDTVITTKVKSSLFNVQGYKDFDPTRVKVVTEAGVVYLMGLVSHDEGNAVGETVRGVSGVEKVVKVFEYTK